jgi:hypothetical protein
MKVKDKSRIADAEVNFVKRTAKYTTKYYKIKS